MRALPAPIPHPRRAPRTRRRGALSSCAAALLSASALLSVATLSSPASANGRFPAAGLIASHPSDPSRLMVRATYGLLATLDGGERWRWICESVVGFGGNEDPMLAFLADGTIIAGVFDGLSASKSGGCDWSFAQGDLQGRYVIDLSADRGDPSRAVLVVSTGLGAGRFLTQLWETSDNADSWTKAGVDLPEDFLAHTVDAAPSDRARVYVSGRYGAPDYVGALQRTDDRGATWERLDIAGSDDTRLPFLGAIDPVDPDVVYVRLDGDPTDALLVSKDGGRSFTTAFESAGDLLGFALSPDGATVIVGGPQDGIWRAPAASLSFEKISDIGARCLTWTAEALFACGDEFADGFTVGRSSDGGESFSALLHLDGLCGPLECAPESGVASTCTPLWGATELTIGSQRCDSEPPPAEASDGCGCRIGAAGAAMDEDAAPSGGTGAIWLALVAAVASARRRRRAGVQASAT